MKIGVIKEIKTQEYRVAMTPECVAAYVSAGHEVTVQANAGLGAGFSDEQYISCGASIEAQAARIFQTCDMIVKVKEPLPGEYDMFREGQILYTYLHLAAEKSLTDALLARKVRAVAYETIELDNGTLPCLKPMSEIAGRLAPQEGAKCLEKPQGGRGVLLGGVPGVERGKVAILGGGTVGTNACKIALGMGAEVTVLDINAQRMEYLEDIFDGKVKTLYSTAANIDKAVRESDLVIGAVLIPGAKAPHVITREHLANMKEGSVIVDVAVDQGGCVETTRPTTHDNPTYVVDGVVHYCVANMPGAVSYTSTRALTSTTLQYGLMLANHGVEDACRISKPLAKGVNTFDGQLTYKAVADAFNMHYTPLKEMMRINA